MDLSAATDVASREQSEITLGLLVLFAILVVVLLDLHFHWAEKVEERQNKLEKRIKALEEGPPSAGR